MATSQLPHILYTQVRGIILDSAPSAVHPDMASRAIVSAVTNTPVEEVEHGMGGVKVGRRPGRGLGGRRLNGLPRCAVAGGGRPSTGSSSAARCCLWHHIRTTTHGRRTNCTAVRHLSYCPQGGMLGATRSFLDWYLTTKGVKLRTEEVGPRSQGCGPPRGMHR